MIQYLKIALSKGIRAITVTRPVEDFKAKDRPALERVVEILKKNGLSVVFRHNIHQKFAVMDQKTVWYGSINLLSYGGAQESIMRIESSNIASELIRSIESQSKTH
jgi:phosphatidylserine/phosphatidylglycerophosphate/cardiolipin synthase-like enzyme